MGKGIAGLEQGYQILMMTALIILAMRRVMGKRRRQTETKLEKEKKNREEGKS